MNFKMIKKQQHVMGWNSGRNIANNLCMLFIICQQFLSFEQIWFQIEQKILTYMYQYIQNVHVPYIFFYTKPETHIFFSLHWKLSFTQTVQLKKKSCHVCSFLLLQMGSVWNKINIWQLMEVDIYKCILFNTRITPLTNYHFNRQTQTRCVKCK
jgi:hypothetical protein